MANAAGKVLTFIASLFFPFVTSAAALLMCPLMLENPRWKIVLVAVLAGTPTISLSAALKLKGRVYYRVIAIVLILQTLLEALINNWLRLFV